MGAAQHAPPSDAAAEAAPLPTPTTEEAAPPPTAASRAEKNAAQNALQLPAGLDSGDIVLFNRRCTSFSFRGAMVCIAAKISNNSRWDHVGLVIRHPATGELLFLEADFGGVRLRSLEQRVHRSRSNEIAVRRLSVVRTSSMRETFYAFAQEMLGRPYEIGADSMLARVVDPLARQERERLNALLIDKRAQVDEINKELQSAAVTDMLRRLLEAERDRVQQSCDQIHGQLMREMEVAPWPEEPPPPPPASATPPPASPRDEAERQGFFCSQLVAAAYQRAGVLGSYPPPTRYLPKDFSSEQKYPPGVHLLKSARLSNEIYLRRAAHSPRAAAAQTSVKDVGGIKEGDAPPRENRNFIRESLKRTPVYRLVPDEYKLSHLIKSFRARVVEQGDVVFEQGDYGDKFFIVQSGVVERFMQKGGEDPILVNTMGPKTAFGLTAFSFNTPRVSTIRAKERTLLWELDRPTFELFRDVSSDVKSIQSAAENRSLRRYLREHFLFRRLDKIGPNELDEFFLVRFRAGETVFKQNDPGDNLYIIKSGELERHIRRPRPKGLGEERAEDGDDVRVKTFYPGQSFGELSLMYNAPRAATVRARTDVECWAISAESFHRLNLSGGTQHLRAVFNKNASVLREGQAYMTRDDLLRFAGADAFPDEDRHRLAALLIALVASNRVQDSVKNQVQVGTNLAPQTTDKDFVNEPLLLDFWEFVRFDIVLNQPSAGKVFAFRLADQHNTGFVSLDEMENLLYAYADIDDRARELLKESNPILRKHFGKSGSRTLSVREFKEVADDILPRLFVEDVKTLIQHMLNMDVVGGDSTEDDVDNIAFIEPDGSLTVIGSQFMNSPAREGVTKYSDISMVPLRTTSSPRWLTQLDWWHLFAVGVSGVVSKTSVAPLERLKILMQTHGVSSFSKSWTSSFRKMIAQDLSVARGLFRGNGANIIRIVPSAAIQLLIVDQLRDTKFIKNLMQPSGVTMILSGTQVVSGEMRNRAIKACVIGGIAGVIAATVTYPFDFVRGRLSVQRRGFEPYRGTFHGIREAWKSEGFLSLYRGISPSVMGAFPYVGLSFAMYETLRPILPKRNDETGTPTTGSSIFCGVVAMATGQVASYPFDTCRRRMQIAGFDKTSNAKATTFLASWREIRQQMGWRGYFRGILPNLLKIAPASAVSFVAYERVRASVHSF